MTDAFFINWQDPETRHWFPVAKLMRSNHIYTFAYTKGSLKSPRFQPFANMNDSRSVYVSTELFPIFANRVMNEKRPEFAKYAEWSGMGSTNHADPLLLMARMGGGRATDTLQVHPVPEPLGDGRYQTAFFCHGISHVSESTQDRTLRFTVGERLYPMLDLQNPYDENAVALRSADPATMIGYCPRYLAIDLRKLAALPDSMFQVTVKQVNYDAPTQFRLLCEATSRWPGGFRPNDDVDHQPIAQYDHAQIYRDYEPYLKPVAYR